MGGGSYSVDDYRKRAASKAAAGIPTFDHDAYVRTTGDYTVHELLDPLHKAGDLSPHAGQVIREVMVSDEHPNPTPIAIILDVTGSNIEAATVVHSKLPQLHGMLMRRGVIEDPQILFGATGDAHSDRAPLQIGQFESDNRGDEQLEKMILEGNGGGQAHETYELAAYYLARHTYLETYEKQGRKGYAFFIGDEMPYEQVKRNYGAHTLKELTGDVLEADISTATVFAELQEKYHVFFLFQLQGSYEPDHILPAWRELLGERAVVLDDPSAVCETITMILASLEGNVSLDESERDLIALGANSSAIAAAKTAASNALAVAHGGSSSTTLVDGDLDDLEGDGADRL